MPYEEDKLSKGENLSDFAKRSESEANKNPTTDKQLFWPCENCGGTFKMGYDEDKKKELPQNPDGSRHQKWKYPPREEGGKKIWEWTCTKSKDDWGKKWEGVRGSFSHIDKQSTWKPQPIESITLPDLTKIEQGITNKLHDQAKALSFHKLAILKGVQAACKEVGITHPATIGMIYNRVDRVINQ